jgi:hypothetical protein
MGVIIMSFSVAISGLGYALIKGWSYALVVVALVPIITISTVFLTKII